MPNAQDLRRAAGWRAGCSAGGMTDKAIRSGRWFGEFLILPTLKSASDTSKNSIRELQSISVPNR